MPIEVERLLVRIEANQAQVEKQMARIAKSYTTNARTSEKAWTAANQNIANSARRSTRALEGFFGANRSRRFVVQNTANQLQDIAVQLAAGTSAARTFGQQLPQLLGGFGPLGAVLGTVAAFALPAAGALLTFRDATFNQSDASKEAETAISELAKAVDEYSQAAKAAEAPTAKLAEQYGAAVVKARKLAETNKLLAGQGGFLDLATAAKEIGDQFGTVNTDDLREVVRLQEQLIQAQEEGERNNDPFATLAIRDQLNQFRDLFAAIGRVREQYDLTAEGAQNVVLALADLIDAGERLRNAEGFEAQRQAAEGVRTAIEAVQTALNAATNATGPLNAETLAYKKELQGALDEATQLVGKIDESTGAAKGATKAALELAAALDAAANAADGIIENLDRSIARQRVLLRTVGDVAGRTRELADLEFSQSEAKEFRGGEAIFRAEFERQREIVRARSEQLGILQEKTKELEKQHAIENRTRGGGRRRGGGGRQSRGGTSRAGLTGAIDFSQNFGGITSQIQSVTAAIQGALGQMDAMGQSLDQNAVAAEKARIQFQLLAAAQREGIEITPELKGRIDQLSTAYAQAKVAADTLGKANTNLTQSTSEFGSIASNVIKSFISDLKNGATATEALSRALEQVGNRLLDIALNSIFSGPGGLGGLGSLFGFANGGQVRRYARGGILDGRGTGSSDSNVGLGPSGPMRFSRGEFLVRNRSVTPETLPILEAINSGNLRRMVAGGVTDGMAGRMPNIRTGDTKIINAIDGPSFLAEALSGRSGERVLLNHVSARPRAFRQALGV